MSALPEIDDPIRWVDAHLGHLTLEGRGATVASRSFRGGQDAADAALAAWDVRGYARRRNEVFPLERRGASRLSPYIRHGLLSLPTVWEHVAASRAPAPDVEKFLDELLWQEYARHLYARLGPALALPRRAEPPADSSLDASGHDPWDTSMACIALALDELHHDGWLVNQTRMWLASQWTVRHGARWTAGEQHFFQHLLDGSRAANRSGWQWTVGSGTGRPYGFSRWQVEKRAPGLCGSCVHRARCPIEHWPESADRQPQAMPRGHAPRTDRDADNCAGPAAPTFRDGSSSAAAVWITAESLGGDDPAMRAHPDLPAVFVFDEALLRRVQLSSKRLVFLAETLAGVAETGRPVTVMLGDPVVELGGLPVAATFAPVPGWRRRAAAIRPTVVYPWPWLRRPAGEPVESFSAWRRRSDGPTARRSRVDRSR